MKNPHTKYIAITPKTYQQHDQEVILPIFAVCYKRNTNTQVFYAVNQVEGKEK